MFPFGIKGASYIECPFDIDESICTIRERSVTSRKY
ncbi:hypothetical protein AvCA_20580 [Azotobacter vinelandii CA]|uniref:Uncharacterized protein n=2 Tax=Azotobacter vinelandii TaxID=354 RepID=C1DF58_AZOVD|nr:hypothetical protein Avin_20580 [Azotobacter vinelandii DJ]AGK16803.1 hypothetical protein AvCA_20580 [Azotobacter vinelandii CA]AGK20365.1 hypothetical protein AvCA6_20580 [Azotobacter vinelandii CA6]